MSWLQRTVARLKLFPWRLCAKAIGSVVFRIIIAALVTSLWGGWLRETFAVLAALGGTSFVSAVIATLTLYVQAGAARLLWEHLRRSIAELRKALRALINLFRNWRK